MIDTICKLKIKKKFMFIEDNIDANVTFSKRLLSTNKKKLNDNGGLNSLEIIRLPKYYFQRILKTLAF